MAKRKKPATEPVRNGSESDDAPEEKPEGQPERVAYAIKMLCHGNRYTPVRDDIAKRWDISTRQAEKDIKRARAEIRDVLDTEIDQWRAEAVLFYGDCKAAAYEAGKFNDAISAQKEIANLFGLNAPRKHEVDVNAHAAAQVSEIVRRLAKQDEDGDAGE